MGRPFPSTALASTYIAQTEPSLATVSVGQLELPSCALYEPTVYRWKLWPSSEET